MGLGFFGSRVKVLGWKGFWVVGMIMVHLRNPRVHPGNPNMKVRMGVLGIRLKVPMKV